MPRKYQLKNPYYKNARTSIEDTISVVMCFVRNIKVSVVAENVGISEVTVHKIYRRLRQVIMSSGFYTDFAMYLEENEYMLWTLYRSMRSFLYNIDVVYDQEYIDKLGISFELLEKLGMDEILGIGRYHVTTNQLIGCARYCETETPPLVIQKYLQEGRLNELIEKRLSCKTCPLRLLEFYKPAKNVVTYRKYKPGENGYFEPHYKYREDPRDLMILWLEVLGDLANYRNIPKSKLPIYAMHSTISRIIKRSEYKVKNVKYGAEVHPLFLDVLQLKELEKGYTYRSLLEVFVVKNVLMHLKDKPI